MSTKLPRLAFDIDGVFANFMQGFMSIMNTRFQTNFHYSQVTEYHPIGAGKLLTEEQWNTTFDLMKQTPYFWANLKPFDQGFFSDINLEMMNFTFNGYFVTRRTNLLSGAIADANALTRIWLENVGLPSYTSVVSLETTPRVDVLRALEIDAYIDDWGEQFEECRGAGINAYLMDRPYNQTVDTPYRVYNVRQFIDRTLRRIPDVTNVFVHENTVAKEVEYRSGRMAASAGSITTQ